MPNVYESFNQADSTIIGPNHTWTKESIFEGTPRTVANEFTVSTTSGQDGVLRAEAQIASGDMYAECTIKAIQSTSQGNMSFGPAVRLTTTGTTMNTMYAVELHNQDKYYLYKLVNGVDTAFKNGVSLPSGLTSAAGGVLRLEVEGSTIRMYYQGVLVTTVTDTAVPASTANQATGLQLYQMNDTGKLDDFRAGTLPLPASTFHVNDFTEDFSSDTLPTSKWASRGSTVEILRGMYDSAQTYNSRVRSVRVDFRNGALTWRMRPSLPSGTREQFLQISLDGENFYRYNIVGAQIFARKYINNSLTELGPRQTWDPDVHAWLRVRHDGTNLLSEFSADGETWSVLNSTPTPWDLQSVYFEFNGGLFSGETVGGRLYVDSVNVFATLPADASRQSWIQHANFNARAIELDRTYDLQPLTIRGVHHPTGWGAHAPSDLEVWVPRGAKSFSATVGIDDEVAAGTGAVRFEIWDGDKVTRYAQSPVLTRDSSPYVISAVVTDVPRLRLVVVDEGATTNDHADWGTPRFVVTNVLLLTGSLAPAGAVVRQFERDHFGVLAPEGLWSYTRVIYRSFASSLAPTALRTRSWAHFMAGSSRPTGALSKWASLLKIASVSATSLLGRTYDILRGGTVAVAGSHEVVALGAVFMRAGAAIMKLRPAGEIRMRFRGR